MRSVEQWQQQIPGALAEFGRRAVDARDIDFTCGLIATGILWPLRQAVQEDDNAAAHSELAHNRR